MSFIGKRVDFKLSNGHSLGGVVAEVRVNPADERDIWYEMEDGWTISERHVVAAYWHHQREVK